MTSLSALLHCFELLRAVTPSAHPDRFMGFYQDTSEDLVIMPAREDPDMFVILAQGKRGVDMRAARLVAPAPVMAREVETGSVTFSNGETVHPQREDFRKNYYRFSYSDGGDMESVQLSYGLVAVNGNTEKRLEIKEGRAAATALEIPRIKDTARQQEIIDKIVIPELRERIASIRPYAKSMHIEFTDQPLRAAYASCASIRELEKFTDAEKQAFLNDKAQDGPRGALPKH